MQPTPPMALKPSAMSSLPESWANSSPHASRCALTRPRLPVASLIPTTVGSSRISARRLDRDVRNRARRHVVDDDRQVRRFGRGAEVGGKPRLARLIVIRHDHERRVGAGILRGRAHLLDRRRGRIAAAAGDHRYAAVATLRPQSRRPGGVRLNPASRLRPSCRTGPVR